MLQLPVAKIIIVLLISPAVAACNIYQKYGYGKVAGSRLEVSTEVRMPANAPGISQRYMSIWGPSDGKPVRSPTSGEHKGFDLLVPTKTPVIAVDAGEVEQVELSVMFGRQVILNHAKTDQGFRIQTRYFHLSETIVAQGDPVSRGQILGYSDTRVPAGWHRVVCRISILKCTALMRRPRPLRSKHSTPSYSGWMVSV